MVKSIEYDPLIAEFGVERKHLYEVLGESMTSGEPYLLMCKKCGDLKVCLLIQVSPLGGDDYRVLLLGLLVVVSRDHVLDEKLEIIFRFSETIRSVSGEVFFYIPRDISVKAYNILCGDRVWDNALYKPISVEEALLYIE